MRCTSPSQSSSCRSSGGERMARVHEHHDADQARARARYAADQFIPLRAQRLRHARVAISRQIDQRPPLAELIEVDGLRAARRLAGATRAACGRASALMALDLPTLERPAKAISGTPGRWQVGRPGRPTARNRLARRRFMREAGNSNKIALSKRSGEGDDPSCALAVGLILRTARLSPRPAKPDAQGAGHRGAGLRGLPCRRRQQHRPRQSEDRRPVRRIPRQATRRLQGAGRQEGGARESRSWRAWWPISPMTT